MKKSVLILLTIVSFSATYSQVDITKYAANDLFAVKPVIDSDNLDEEEETTTSQWDVEIQKGIDYWSAGAFDDAQYLFEQLNEEYPQITAFPYYLGMINYEQQAYEESIEYFQQALKIDPLFLDAKYMLGIVMLDNHQFKESKSIFGELEKVEDYAAYGHHGMALYNLELGSVYRAKHYLTKTVKTDPSFLQAYVPLISINLYFGNLSYARKLIEQALEEDSEWQQGIIIRAMISLLQSDSFEQFEQDLNYLISIAPENYHYYSLKGYLQMELGQPSEAVKMFREAYNLEGDSLRIGEYKFNSKFKKNEGIHRSLNYYFENYAMAPEARQLLDRGICQAIDRSQKQAVLLFDSALLIEKNPVIYLFKGCVQRTFFIPKEKIIASFTKSIEMDSTNWIAYSYRGEEYLKLGEFGAAYQDFTQVITLKPKTKEGYKSRGNILMESGQYAHAYKDYSFGLGIDSTDTDLYFNRAVTAFSLGYYENAMVDLNTIIKRKPKDGDAYYWVYKCGLALGDSVQSIHLLDSASKYSKYQTAFHKELLVVAEQFGLPDIALNAHDRLVKYNRFSYGYLLGRARYHLDEGNIDFAIKDLEKFIKHKKNSGEGHYYLGVAFKKSGKQKEGQKHLKKAKKLGFNAQPDP